MDHFCNGRGCEKCAERERTIRRNRLAQLRRMGASKWVVKFEQIRLAVERNARNGMTKQRCNDLHDRLFIAHVEALMGQA